MRVIKALVAKYANALKKPFPLGLLPLHRALQLKREDELFCFLLEEYSEAAAVPYNQGTLPVHIAISNNHSVEIVSKMIDAFPEACKAEDSRGNLPIHIAVSKKRSYDVISKLITAFPEACKAKDGEGNTPLHIAVCNDYSFEFVSKLITAFPGACKAEDSKGNLPIHIAVCNNYSFEVVSKMIAAFPGSCRAQNHEGNLPIHCAILKRFSNSSVVENSDLRLQIGKCGDLQHDTATPNNYYSLGFLKVFVNAFPGSCVISNQSGDVPLQTAVNARSSHTVINFLVASFSDFSNGQKVNSLHLALKNKLAFAVPLLVMYHDADMTMKDDTGDFPIHLAIENLGHASVEAISLLANSYPTSLVEKGRQGLTPLKLAMKCGADKAAIAAILEAYVFLEGEMKLAALQQKVDNINRLPLHIGALCGLSTPSLIDMMQTYPGAVHALSTYPNGACYLPIDDAMGCDCDAEVIVAMLLLFPESCYRTCIRPSLTCTLSEIAEVALNQPISYWLQKERKATKGSLDLKVLHEVMSDLRNQSAGIFVLEEANDTLNLNLKDNYDVLKREGNNRHLPDVPPPSSLVDGAELSLFREMETLRRKLTESDVSVDELRDEFDRFKAVMNEKLEAVEGGTILAISQLRDDDLVA